MNEEKEIETNNESINNDSNSETIQNQVNQPPVVETIKDVESQNTVISNKKKLFKIIVLLIILLALLSLIGYFVYAKYILKEEPFTINHPNKIDTPIENNDIKKDDENVFEDDEYNEEKENFVNISYFSIDDYMKTNLREITHDYDPEESMFFVNKDKKIYYQNFDSSYNSKPIALTDKNNKDIKLLFYDDMSDIILLALNESGQLLISDTVSDEEAKTKFNLAFEDKKFSKMYYFAYPSDTECEGLTLIVLESNNKKYILQNVNNKSKYSLLEYNDDYLYGLETSQPYCSGGTFGINMNMHGDLTYFVLDNNYWPVIDKNNKDFIDIETGTKIIGSKLISLKNSINESEDVSYIIDINNNLFEVRKYQDSYKKIGVVKNIIIGEEYINWPETLTIELTDGTKIVIK